MNDDRPAPGEGEPGPLPPGSFTQDIHHTPIGARVPEEVGRGAFCNATMILQTNEEVVIDFISTLSQPQQVAARVVMTPNTFAQVISALRENVKHYEETFGRLISHEPSPQMSQPAGPSSAPAGPATWPQEPQIASAGPSSSEIAAPDSPPAKSTHPPTHPAGPDLPPQIEDLYEQLKLPDRLLGGTYANVVMIRHLAEEFSFDFIANFYPRPVVVARIFLPAGRIPSFLDAMSNSLHIFRKKAAGRMPPPRPDDPSETS
jgi:hypothetical protein